MIRAAAALLALAALPTFAFGQACYPPRAIVDMGGGCAVQHLQAVVPPLNPCAIDLFIGGGQQAARPMLFALSWNPTPTLLPWPPFPQNCVIPHDLGIVTQQTNWLHSPTVPLPPGTSIYLTALPIFSLTPIIDPLTAWAYATNTVRFDW